MLTYAIRRTIVGVLMLVVMSMVTYVLFFSSSPHPEKFACGPKCTPAQLEVTKKALGFDKPIVVQWSQFMKGIVTGRDYPNDKKLKKSHPEIVSHCGAPCLGFSYFYKQNVRTVLQKKLPISISLAIVAFVIWMFFAVLLGVISALTKGSIIDRAIVGFSLLAYSFPSFFIALILIDYLTIRTSIFKTPEYVSLTQNPASWLYNLLLPGITLALVYMAGYIRITRAFVLETLTEDYIRTARSKGLREGKVIFKHTLRAVLTPLVTLSGLDLAGLLGGAIITEKVFNFDGVGNLAVSAIGHFDLPVVVGIVLVVATFVIAANIIVDLLYAVIDPRVRLG